MNVAFYILSLQSAIAAVRVMERMNDGSYIACKYMPTKLGLDSDLEMITIGCIHGSNESEVDSMYAEMDLRVSPGGSMRGLGSNEPLYTDPTFSSLESVE